MDYTNGRDLYDVYHTPAEVYLVTLSMVADDGTQYLTTRTERARDPDDASGQAQEKELAVQRGCVLAGGAVHTLLGIVKTRRIADGRVT